MNNDEQSYKDKPLIIHGAIAHNKDIKKYGKKLPVLVPFDFYNRKTMIKPIIWHKWWNYLFVDSGAFSVSQGNASIELKKYVNFIKENKEKINHYASLDVVGDGKQSLNNWKKMRKMGLKPIPVFHDGESYDILKEYASECSYIGLGAVAYKSTRARLLFFDKVFDLYPDRSKIGFHGFGVMDLFILLRYPWRSVDSSTIATAARFGEIIYGKDLNRVTISKRGDIFKERKTGSGLKQELIKLKFKQYNRNFEIAIKGDSNGINERILFNLSTIEEYVKIPNEFKPELKIISLFD